MGLGSDDYTLDGMLRRDIDLIYSPSSDDPAAWCAAYDRLRSYQRKHLLTKLSFVGGYLALSFTALMAAVEILPEGLLPFASIAFFVGLYFVDEAAGSFFKDRTNLKRATVNALLDMVEVWEPERRRLQRLVRNGGTGTHVRRN